MAKAQMHAFRVIIALIVVGLIVFFGYKGISTVAAKACDTKFLVFSSDLKSSIEDAGSDIGSRTEWKGDIPCNVDKIIFVDKSKDVSFISLAEYPDILDSITDGVNDNVFLLKGDKVTKSFFAGSLNIGNPYFDCYNARSGVMNIWIEGSGQGAKFLKIDERYDCTFDEGIVVELSTEDIEEVLREIVDELDADDQVISGPECGIERSFENGEIKISKQGCDLEYYEKIPKCAVEALTDAINSGDLEISGDEGSAWFNISEDPIIMWDLGAGDDEKGYIIDKLIDENCKREFKGVGVVDAPADLILAENNFNNLKATLPPGLDKQFDKIDNNRQRFNAFLADINP